MTSDDETRARGPKAASLARAVAHKSSGGHSPHIAQLRNRVEHDPNPAFPPRTHSMSYVYKPYPKWLHFEGDPSVLVQDEAEHEAYIASLPEAGGDAKLRAKPGRPKKAQADAPESMAADDPEVVAETPPDPEMGES